MDVHRNAYMVRDSYAYDYLDGNRNDNRDMDTDVDIYVDAYGYIHLE